MKLAGEAGSLLKIEEELAAAIDRGRDEWEEKLPLFRVTEYGIGDRGRETFYRHVPGEERDFWDCGDLTLRAIEEYAAGSQAWTTFGGGCSPRMPRGGSPSSTSAASVRRRPDESPFGDAASPPKGRSRRAIRAPRVTSTPRSSSAASRLLRSAAGRRHHLAYRFLPLQFQEWRQEILLKEAPPVVFADLGGGVLDTMVEVAAYCLEVAA